MTRKEITIREILNHYPLRVAITDYCNLRCFFCSNEGMHLNQKNKVNMPLEVFEYLIKVLKSHGLTKLSLTGGEPTIHPKINQIIDFIDRNQFDELFFHTNGCFLSEPVIKKLSRSFTKLAVSIHAIDYPTWHAITKGTRMQFDKQRKGLDILSKGWGKMKIELKYVPIKGYNDSAEAIGAFLELCNKYHFIFKFLNFEAITPEQSKLVIPFEKIKNILLGLGCQAQPEDKYFRGQHDYLPIKRFRYKDTAGVAIEIGCGDPEVCRNCYKSNEVFITPYLTIKPCHADKYEINIADSLRDKNEDMLLKSIIESRLFLAKAPGAGKVIWQNYQ